MYLIVFKCNFPSGNKKVIYFLGTIKISEVQQQKFHKIVSVNTLRVKSYVGSTNVLISRGDLAHLRSKLSFGAFYFSLFTIVGN